MGKSSSWETEDFEHGSDNIISLVGTPRVTRRLTQSDSVLPMIISLPLGWELLGLRGLCLYHLAFAWHNADTYHRPGEQMKGSLWARPVLLQLEQVFGGAADSGPGSQEERLLNEPHASSKDPPGWAP